MTKQNVYHVLPDNASGKWRVAQKTARRASEVLNEKEDAVRRAKELAKRNVPSHVIIHETDGTIQKEYSYVESSFKHDDSTS